MTTEIVYLAIALALGSVLISLMIILLGRLNTLKIAHKKAQQKIDNLAIVNSIFTSKYDQLSARLDKEGGKADQAVLKAKISQKLAERAFNMASSANTTLVGVAKTLQSRPKVLNKEAQIKNEFILKKLEEELPGMNYLGPLLTDQELEIFEMALKQSKKTSDNSAV